MGSSLCVVLSNDFDLYPSLHSMSVKFENEIVDFLLSSPSQDAFKWQRLRVLLQNVRHEVFEDQVIDVMQILIQCFDELRYLLEWKRSVKMNASSDK